MATTVNEHARLEKELLARRSDSQKQLSRRLFWQDLLTSLWAPLSVFGLVFIPYVVLIEYSPDAYLWAQPALKTFGLVMLAWFLGLIIARWVPLPYWRLRHLRREASEQTGQLGRVLGREGHRLEAGIRQKLVDQASRVDAARLEPDAGRLDAELQGLEKLADKHLAKSRRSSRFELVLGFAKALAIALVIRTVLVEPFKIPSGSMIPTLDVGDQVFVNKFIYGVRIPFANVVPFIIVRPPKRGDVIVFNNPVDTSKDFIKRVVGTPGDRIEIIDEVVYVDGKAQARRLVDEDFMVHSEEGGQWTSDPASLYQEDLSGVKHAVLEAPSHPRGSLTEGPWTVPPNHVFVLGDNRDNSSDSRYGLGVTGRVEFVPYGNIKGKAMVIWLSLSYDGLGSRLFGGTGLRLDRLFLPVR